MDSSQASSPATPVINQWAHEQNGKDGAYAWVQQHGWTSSHQGWPGYSHCWAPNLPTAGTSNESPIWYHSPGWSHSYLVAGWLHWTTSIMQCFVLTGLDPYSGYRSAFPACNASPKIPAMYLQNALYMVFHTALFLIKELISQQMKCSNGPMIIRFTGVTMSPTVLKQLAG